MYESFYNLIDKPFSLSPDPRFYYGSKEHNRVLAYLHYGIKQGEGFIVVTGDVGTGKSTLVNTLSQEIEKNQDVICTQVVSTQLAPEDLLRVIATSFGLSVEGMSKSGVLESIRKFLLAQVEQKKQVLLIVDEAQNLELHSLEELRMLSNFQKGNRMLLQSFLLGQAEFRDVLRRAELEQFRQRIIASYHLGPMDKTETRSYIEHRLKVAGWRDDPHFNLDAFSEIYRYTNGVPRRINTLCDRILLYTFSEELHEVDGKCVQAVVDELDEELHFKSGAGTQASASTNGSGDAGSLEQRVAELEKIVDKGRELIALLMTKR